MKTEGKLKNYYNKLNNKKIVGYIEFDVKNNRDKIKFLSKERVNFVLNCKLSNEMKRDCGNK